MKLKSYLISLLLLSGALVFIPLVSAAATVLPSSSATLFVPEAGGGFSPTFFVAINDQLSSHDFTLTNPDGRFTIKCFANEPIGPAQCITGASVAIQLSQPSTIGGRNPAPGQPKWFEYQFIVSSGSNYPVDGTWTITWNTPQAGTPEPDVLYLQFYTKSALFCLKSQTNTQPQLWNWRTTTTNFVDDNVPASPASAPCTTSTPSDPVTQADEDPNNAVYFEPSAVTKDETIETTVAQPANGPPTTSETLHGFINPANGGRTFNDAKFYYTLGSICTTAVNQDAGDPPASGDFSTTISGLTSGATYSYFVRGFYSSGTPTTMDGTCRQFIAPSSSTTMDDQIITESATGITSTAANLNGEWAAGTTNGDELQNGFFVWVPGTSTATDLRTVSGFTQTSNIALSGTVQSLTQAISGLGPSNTYSFQLIGKRTSSPAWEKLGSVLYFTTNPDTSNPSAFTSTSSVACGPPPVLTMNGVWAKGQTQSGNTFTRFVSIQGVAPFGDTDLRDNPSADFTSLVDSGSGSSGTATGTVFYNTLTGNSYQFLARATSTGVEQLGTIVFSVPGICTPTPTSIVGFSHTEDNFDLSVSQAQCNGDPTSFSIDTAINSGTFSSINVDVYNTNTGVLVLTIPQTQFFQVASGITSSVFIASATFSPGEYSAVGEITLTGTLAKDFFDSKAFNVPAGACGNTVVDVLAINSHTDIVRTKLNQNLTRIEQTGNETEEHTDYIMTQNNKTLNHIDYNSGLINSSVVHIDNQFIRTNSYVNRTQSNLYLQFIYTNALINGTKSLIHFEHTQTNSYINLTRTDIAAVKAVVDETEEHTDNLLFQFQQTRTDINNTRIQVDELEGHADDLLSQLISSRSTDNVTQGILIQLRTEHRSAWSSQNASFGDLNNHFHQTDSYINLTKTLIIYRTSQTNNYVNQTNSSIHATLMTFVFGGNVSFNDTQIQQDLVTVLNPLNDFYWLFLVITSAVALFLLPRFRALAGFLMSMLAMFYAYQNFTGIFRSIGIAVSVFLYGIAIWKALDDGKEKKLKQHGGNENV